MGMRNIVRLFNDAMRQGEASTKKTTALTANTTLSRTHFGGVITNRGAGGALNHTIPDASADLRGQWFTYFGIADQNQTFTAETADTLITLDDIAADSLAFSTANEKIGASATFVCDGTSWLAVDIKGTATIAT